MPKPGRKPFTLEHEDVSKKVAADTLKASQEVYDSFDERPYNSDTLTPEEQTFAYAKIRENPDYLNSLHAEAQKKRFLPPDVLDRKAILGFMADEAKFRLDSGEWDQARYQKAVKAIEGAKR